MNGLLRNIVPIIIAMTSFNAVAVEEPHDTVCFYDTWEQIFYNEPALMYVDPYIEYFPYSVDFWTNDKITTDSFYQRYIAACLSDGTWLLNSRYLYQYFKVDLRYLNHYVPLFFNEKTAFAIAAANPGFMDEDDDSRSIDYYYIDFVRYRVRRVDPSVLSELLQDYHDLQVRYEGMKDYNKRNIIEDYFFKYIDRATADVMHPYILDLVE